MDCDEGVCNVHSQLGMVTVAVEGLYGARQGCKLCYKSTYLKSIINQALVDIHLCLDVSQPVLGCHHVG